jgi:gliding motility-associated-like protein
MQLHIFVIRVTDRMQKNISRILLILVFSLPVVLHAYPATGHNPQGIKAVSTTTGFLSPSLRCLAVQPNGDVVLSWVLSDTSTLSTSFNCYYIYSSTSPAGPFSRIDSLFTYSTTSYTNVGANANSISRYYYVQLRYHNGNIVNAAPVDTLRSILLTVTNPNNGTAQLNWTPLASPLPNTSLRWYHIYREYPTGTWKALDSTQSLRYIDTITVCHAYINYKIEINDSSGCTSVSNIAGGTFSNIIAPKVVQLDSVSVNSGGQATLGWVKDPSSDTKGYIIYKFTGGIWVAIDTVHGASVTSFTPPSSTAGGGVETYGVAAYDSCMNVSVLSQVQKSIFVTAKKDICDMSVLLTWNSFINMPNAISSYHILVSVNGGPTTIAGTTASTDTTFNVTNLTPQSTYCFTIVANNGNFRITAQSNVICYTATIPNQPKFNYLRIASVMVPANTVKLTAFIDITANAKSYHFYRANSPTSSPVHIASVSTPVPANFSIVDNTVDASLSSYYYTMHVVDSCGNERTVSNEDETMFLQATTNDATATNVLTWNDYSRWLGGVSSYNIYRAIDGVWAASPVANVSFSNAGMNTYSDNVSAFYPTSGKFEYYIEALEGSTNPYGYADTSHSNVAEALQNATFFIPNAFKPAGVNKIFKPVWTFVDPTDYHFSIFDRWGEKIFETSDKNAGWDGTIKGKPGEVTAYVYLISFKTAFGEYIDRKGSVTLLR